MFRFRRWQHFLPPLILAVSLFTLYLCTLAPGLTWANDGSDGGDLITAAATGGVPHPTGYPLYLLVARLFQFLPIGSLAFRTNLLSALATSVAAALVYSLVTRSLSTITISPSWPAGIAAGYAFGLAPLIWSQAVITEVYGLQIFLVALIFWLYTEPVQEVFCNPNDIDRSRGLALGLATTNHITAILLVPIALLLGCMYAPRADVFTETKQRAWFQMLKLDKKRSLRQLELFGGALLIYLIVPLRALASPVVNWGNAVTLERFWWLVSGQLYQGYYLQLNAAGIWERIQSWAALILDQFGLVGVVLGLVGLIVFAMPTRVYILTAWSVLVYTAFAIFYRSFDSYVYLMPVVLSFAIWIGLAIGGLLQQLSRRLALLSWAIGIVLITYFVYPFLTRMKNMDASKDHRAESFAGEVLSAMPEDAIVFAKGDQAVFSLWYFHFALGKRPDLAILATDLLHFDWYQENLRSTYPSLRIPGPFPWTQTITSANPQREVCYIQYSDGVEMDCLSSTVIP